MKKLFLIFTAVLFTTMLSAQTSNTFKYVVKSQGGIINTLKGLADDKIDSSKVSGTTKTDYQGATILSPVFNAADITPGVAVADTATMLTPYARKVSPALAGVPTAPTAAVATNTTQIATTAFVNAGFAHRVCSSNTQLTNTGNTNENTVYTGTIPANSIGVNGSFIISYLWSGTNGADDKTIRVKFGGTTVSSIVLTTSASASLMMQLFNRNSASAQVAIYVGSGLTPYLQSAGPLATYTINTAAEITVTVTLQNETAGNSNNLEAFEIVAYP